VDDAQPDLFGEALPDEAAERSRATMWDVPRFAEAHSYRAVVVENVVDAAKWPPFKAWLMAMDSLGYEHQLVWLNSMHAQAAGLPAPQSRDRLYVVFHRTGSRRPDVTRWTRPRAWCPKCDVEVDAVQSWKRPDRAAWGRYGTQYVYRCPSVRCRNQIVEPTWLPAAAAIDWSLPATRIGDRARPLGPKTMARIVEGLRRHGAALQVPVEGRDGKQATPVADPMRTLTARNETGLVIPLRANNTVKTTRHPFDTIAAAGNHHALVVDYNGPARTTADPLPTQTTVEGNALATAALDPHDCRFRMFEPYEIAAGMAFPDGYLMLGNKRERVRLAGNAVTPPAARDLIAAVAAALNGDAA
jgi:DNA (cytosine-5)-methyltransferase 1